MVNKFDDDEHQDVEKSIRMTEDRDKREEYVHGVANPRIEDGYRTAQSAHSAHRDAEERYRSR